MANTIKNIKTGRVFKRINKNSPIFTDGEDYIDLVYAEIVNGDLIRIDTKGNRYVNYSAAKGNIDFLMRKILKIS